ncbi:hypothetical protein D3C83_262630 [compost metagenome]
MTIWKELLFLGGDLGAAQVHAFAAEELALEAAKRELEARRAGLSAERRDGIARARQRAANVEHELQRCA